ncbi:biotin--[acetyl-CoA-carboxylase] ligase [Sphingopyxis sp. FBM22]|nr:biotin--[acetyl-CoA-carboxylase] ligase [Sphingopyxis yananensis]
MERVQQTGSTSADLLGRLARQEYVGDGHWLVADRQSAGRGRLGRAWGDGFGNFMGSVAIHLTKTDPMAATLALVAAVALTDTVKALAPDLPMQMKWPNDLLLDGAKCAGILLERSGDAVVIGIGVNLVSSPDLPDRRTACFADYDVTFSRDLFGDALAIALMDALRCWRDEGVAAIVHRWLAIAHPIGTPLRVSEQGIDGLFHGLNPDGALRLKMADGHIVEVHAGDVELLRPVEEGN